MKMFAIVMPLLLSGSILLSCTEEIETSYPEDRFAEYCEGVNFEETFVDVELRYDSGHYGGRINYLLTDDIETVHFIPEHPFKLEGVSIYFKGGEGDIELAVYSPLGGSEPDLEEGALTDRKRFTIHETSEWVDFDLSSEGLYFLPHEHFFIAYHHIQDKPLIGYDDGDASIVHSMYRSQEDIEWYEEHGYNFTWSGMNSNFLMRAKGKYFCMNTTPFFKDISDTSNVSSLDFGRVAFGDVNGDGFDDIITHRTGGGEDGIRLLMNNGDLTFTDWTEQSGISGWGSVFALLGDVNNDGNIDLYLGVYTEQDSDGDGFSRHTEGDCNDTDADINPDEEEIGDGKDNDCNGVADDGTDEVDNDGDGYSEKDGDCNDTDSSIYPESMDVEDGKDNDCDGELDEEGFIDRLLLGNGDGTFTLVPNSGVEERSTTTSAIFLDYDKDGNLDIYSGNWLVKYPEIPSMDDFLFRGNGDGTFVDVSEVSGIREVSAKPCYGVVGGDFDNDLDTDIFVSNYGRTDNLLWRNNGDGTFSNYAHASGVASDRRGPGGNTFGADFGDFDNDGDLDLILAEIAHPRYLPSSDITSLQVNQGPPDYTFEDEREERGIEYDEGDIEPTFFDFDNDGDMDIFISSLYPLHFANLYRQEDDGRFTDVTYLAGIDVHYAQGNTFSDIDGDGDLDLLVGRTGTDAHLHLYLNQKGEENNWVEFKLEGSDCTRDAVGARVEIRYGDRFAMREVKEGKGHFGSQQTSTLHFGLGDIATIDEVSIKWLCGRVTTFQNLEANKIYHIIE